MRKTTLFLFFLFITAKATIDIAGDWGTVFVTWSESPGITKLKEVGTSEPIIEFGQGNPTLGYTVSGVDVFLVLTTSSEYPGVSDSLYLIFPSSLTVYALKEISATEFTPPYEPELAEATIQVARHQGEQNAFYLSSDPCVPISGESEMNVISARMAIDSPMGIYTVDTLGVCCDAWFSGINDYTRPVSCSYGEPVQMWNISGSYGGFSSTAHYAGIRMPDGAPVPGDFNPMVHEYFYSPGMGSHSAHIRAIGSNATEVLGFWTTSYDEELRYTEFPAGSCVASVDEPAPYSMPVLCPLAMTCNPEDDGLLLVWQDGGEIRCAHWNGEWNQYYHVVETGVSSLGHGNLAVCSVDDGYWIAWITYSDADNGHGDVLETRALPEERFISRDIITSIDETSTSAVPSQVMITPNPIPLGSYFKVTAEISGEQGTVEFFDLNGRVAFSAEIASAGSMLISTDGLQPGTYLARVSSEDQVYSQRIVLIR